MSCPKWNKQLSNSFILLFLACLSVKVPVLVCLAALSALLMVPLFYHKHLLTKVLLDRAYCFGPWYCLLVVPLGLFVRSRLQITSLSRSMLPISPLTLASTLFRLLLPLTSPLLSCLPPSPLTLTFHSHLPLSPSTLQFHHPFHYLPLTFASISGLPLLPPFLGLYSRLQLLPLNLVCFFGLLLFHPTFTSSFHLQL